MLKLNTNNYLHKQLNTPSPYRETRKEEISSLNISFSSLNLEEGVLEPLAIRKMDNNQQQVNEGFTQNRSEEAKTEVTKSNQIETPQEKETTAETAKEVEEYT